MVFWKCYYHIVWATKHRQPVISLDHERIIFSTIRSVAEQLNCQVLATDGVSDHLHMAVAIPPSVAVSDWVKRCKGSTSYYVNQSKQWPDPFTWQAGYGVLTFGEKALPVVVDYIKKTITRQDQRYNIWSESTMKHRSEPRIVPQGQVLL